jgi:hypothetical protein
LSDDFSDPVKRALASRVGNLCSNPDCRALTSGPQEDPAKAVNLGVAAHITAASPGGPRYDAALLPEERCAPANGIWLCQNCAKLVDNDPMRFTVDLLIQWKSAAEAEARNRVGKTAPLTSSGPAFNLKIGDRTRIEPIVPREFERAEWILRSKSGSCCVFEKPGSMAHVEIPLSFIENLHHFDGAPALVQLRGRLQWISVKQRWELLSEKPLSGAHDEHGFSKYVDFNYPTRMRYQGTYAWCREDRLPQCLSQGRYVFYDEDGRHLRVRGPDIDQILVSDRP